MIVIAQALALTQAYRFRSRAPVIGWHNLVTIDNIVAGSQQTNYPVTNLANPSTALRWKSNSAAAQTLTVTIGGDGEVDYIGVQGHNFGSAQIAVAVETLGAEDGATWQVALEQLYVSDDDPIILRFEPRFCIGARLVLTPSGVAPVAAVLHVGKLLAAARGLPPGHTPINFGATVRTIENLAEDGGFLGSVVLGEGHSTSVDLRMIDPAEYRSDFEPFRRAGKGTTFFFAWNPKEHPNEVGYCWLANDPRPVISQATGEIDISLQLGAVI